MFGVRSALLWIAVFVTVASAFDFSFGEQAQDPTFCGVSTVRWNGGVPPFSLTIVPVFNFPTNISIPNSAWDNQTGLGIYDYQCDYASGRQLVAFMSDATGLATGGATGLMTVQNPSSGQATCQTHVDASSFKFYLNETSLTQCQTVEIYWDPTAADPVNIIGINPGGQVLQIPADMNQTYINWEVNVPAGTNLVMAAFDGSAFGQGGSGQSLVVQESADDSCLQVLVPTGSDAGSPTKTRAPVVTVTTTEMVKPGKKAISTSAIIGIAVAFFLILLILKGILYWFCCRKPVRAYREARKQRSAEEADEQRRARPLNPIDSHTTHGTRDGDNYTSPFDDQPAISPFWDGAAVHQASPQCAAELGGASSANLISPVTASAAHHPYPPRVALRSEVAGLTLTNASSPTSSTIPTTSLDRSDTSMPLAELLASASSSREQSKMGMTASNPDAGLEGDARPLPRGGWRRHLDGGPIPAPRRRAEDDVLELPPMYDEMWTPSGSSDPSETTRGR